MDPYHSQSNLSSSFLNQLVSEKLNTSNFLIWKRQIIPFIRSQGLLGHLDGTTSVPPEFIPREEKDDKGASSIVYVKNAEFLNWERKDQSVVAYITSTLSQEILLAIPDNCTALQLWERLVQTYSQVSQARVVFLKREFQLLRKDSMTIMEYLNKIKIVTDQLAVIGCAVSDNDMVQQTLSGLGSDYNMIVTSLLCLPVLPTFDELRAKLIQYEMTLKGFSEETHNHPNSQEVFATGVTYGRGRGRGGQGRSGHGGRGLLPTPNMFTHAQGTRSIPTCFFCNKKGHIKANCWHNPENKGKSPQIETKRKFTNTRDSGEIKDLLISALSELKLKQSDEGTWFVDSGAATHVTGDAGKISNPIPYFGKSKIVTGDGSHHPVSHVGKTVIPMSHSTLTLSDVLHAPDIKKNIVSVSKLIDDNNASVEFTPFSVQVKDLRTRETFAEGKRRGNMYVFEEAPCHDVRPAHLISKPSLESCSSSSSSVFSISECNKPFLWHSRLGHCGSHFIEKLVSNNLIPKESLNGDESSHKCSSCLSCARVMYCLFIPLIRELQNLLRLFVLMCGDLPQLSLGLEADII